jgi:hypothetical protein
VGKFGIASAEDTVLAEGYADCNLPLTKLNIYQVDPYNFTFSQSLVPSLKFIKVEIGSLRHVT